MGPNSIVLCTATLSEMNACISRQGVDFRELTFLGNMPWARIWSYKGKEYILVLTGVGMPLTLARLFQLFQHDRPKMILNLGIAGAYLETEFKIGDLVAGQSECFGDLGMESQTFIPLAEMAWADEIYKAPLLLDVGPWKSQGKFMGQELKCGAGCTVNSCTGTAESGLLRKKLFNVDFESMEGAAVALVGHELKIPIAELRAISNFASTRDMRPENMNWALRNLGDYMQNWFG